ncbi:hypothetical protein ACJX0J_018489 [Zea mays]
MKLTLSLPRTFKFYSLQWAINNVLRGQVKHISWPFNKEDTFAVQEIYRHLNFVWFLLKGIIQHLFINFHVARFIWKVAFQGVILTGVGLNEHTIILEKKDIMFHIGCSIPFAIDGIQLRHFTIMT